MSDNATMPKKGEILIVGKITATPMERFDRNQRRAAAVAPRINSKSGVFRFRTWGEFSAWKEKQARA
jgi:hypothetical protein